MKKIMANDKEKKTNNDAPVKPDPETLHTTDPQEEMKGPVSSFMNNVKDEVEEDGRKVNPDPEEEGSSKE
jgi:hypothetical protein